MISELYINDISGSARGVVLVAPPPIVSAPMRGEWIDIVGRDGKVWRSDGGYDNVQLTVEIYIPETADVDAALAWLRGAQRLRWTPNAWEYHVVGVDMKPELKPWGPFSDAGWSCKLTVTAQPYRYRYPAAAAVSVSNSGILTNPGTAASAPLIEVKGSGDINLMVGRHTILLSDLPANSVVLLDCENRLATDSGGNSMNPYVTLLDSSYGRWPRLQPGSNTISWTGTVSYVKITPRWRNL